MSTRMNRKTTCAVILSFAIFSSSTFAVPFTDFGTFQAATGPLTMENFDSAPWTDGSLTQPVNNLGLSWTSQDDLFGASLARSAPRSITDGDITNATSDLISASLPSGVTAFGGWITGESAVVLTAYDALDGVLETVTNSSGGLGSFVFLGVTTGTDIARVEFLSPPTPDTADDFALDDVSFGQAEAVPEPTILALMGLGLAGVGWRRKTSSS